VCRIAFFLHLFGKRKKKTKKKEMKRYMQELFPYAEVFAALDRGPEYNVARELYFKRGETNIRWQALGISVDEFRRVVLEHRADRVDVGGVFSHALQHRQRAEHAKIFEVVGRELVFDLDLSDYGDVRGCNSAECMSSDKSKAICAACWSAMTASSLLLHRWLTTIGGFSNIVWAFSGRRGLHATVLDRNTNDSDPWYWDGESRDHFVQFVQSCERSWATLTRYLLEVFTNIRLRRQPSLLFTCEKTFLEVECCPNTIDRERAIRLLDQHKAKKTIDEVAWRDFSKKNPGIALRTAWKFCGPRLDAGVTRNMMHTLKVFFSVHPATSNIALVLDDDELETFNPCDSTTGGVLVNLKNLCETEDPAARARFERSLEVLRKKLKSSTVVSQPQ
jgi:DNA primase small subunit